jgi:hypothetical protein
MKKEQMQITPAGRVSQQSQNQKGGVVMKAVAQSQIELVRLYGNPSVPSVPWKFVVEWEDYFWPIRWMLYPLGEEGSLWLVKKESPWNEYAREKSEIVGIFIDGELVFAEPEWNNEVLQVWERERVASLFDGVKRGEYSGVVLEENCSEEEREKVEKMLRWLKVIRLLLEDKERITGYGEITFGRYVERYYSEWLGEFREFFEGIGKLKGEERIRYLKHIKESLKKELDKTGFFMYVYYP